MADHINASGTTPQMTLSPDFVCPLSLDPVPPMKEWTEEQLNWWKAKMAGEKRAPIPPPMTADEYKKEKINEHTMILRSFEIETEPPSESDLPLAYRDSVRAAKLAWERNEVSWVDGQGYLWEPERLAFTGTIDEVIEEHRKYLRKQIRVHHEDMPKESTVIASRPGFINPYSLDPVPPMKEWTKDQTAWLEKMFEESITVPMAPPPTAEEYREIKIKSLTEAIEALKKSTLPAEYTDSVRAAKTAWESGKVAWIDGHSYLWGPQGLVAQGPIDEVETKHFSYLKQKIRIYHHDKCAAPPLLGAQSALMHTAPGKNYLIGFLKYWQTLYQYELTESNPTLELMFLYDTGATVGLIYEQDRILLNAEVEVQEQVEKFYVAPGAAGPNNDRLSCLVDKLAFTASRPGGTRVYSDTRQGIKNFIQG
ncbi:hypothetical protein Dda_0842 [Drechslerella dactyloides]|uniref:Uncharacterized protein n=1 Tax=Drechslerella dactyloides TaxID=74499 RepID=A0AAD6J6D0_DREDA|nr:hypothetical protein Dda_0842 [Drechslerella dactyloides]